MLTLGGKATHHIGFAAWITGTIPMKDISAWLILEHTAASFIITRKERTDFAVPIFLVAATTLLTAVGLVHEIITLEDLASYDPAKSFFPSVMTVLGAGLLACKEMAAHVQRNGQIANMFGALVALIGLSAICGYMLQVPAMYYYIPGYTTSMAINTAVAFILLGSVPVPDASKS